MEKENVWQWLLKIIGHIYFCVNLHLSYLEKIFVTYIILPSECQLVDLHFTY